MKLTKFFIIFFIFTLSFTYCRKTKLEITEAGFPKEYKGYSYEGNYGGVVGIYGKGSDYKLVIEGLGDATLNNEQKETVDKIYNTVGKEGIGKALEALSKSDGNNTEEVVNKIIGNAEVSATQKQEIEKLIKKNFGNGESLQFNSQWIKNKYAFSRVFSSYIRVRFPF